MRRIGTILLLIIACQSAQSQLNEFKWQTILHNAGRGDVSINSICKTADSNFMAIGTDMIYVNGSEFYRTLISKLSPDGNVIWRKLIDSSYDQQISNMILLPDSGFAAVGTRKYAFTMDSPVNRLQDVIYYNFDADGNVKKSQLFGGNGTQIGKRIIRLKDGNFMIAAQAAFSSGSNTVPTQIGNTDVWLLKINAMANIQWSKLYGGTLADQSGDVLERADGGLFVCGTTESTDVDFAGTTSLGQTDGFLMSIKANGIREWTKRYGDNGEDRLTSMDFLSDSSIVMGGTYYTAMSPSIDLAAYMRVKLNGSLLWRFYNNIASKTLNCIRRLDQDKNFIAGGGYYNGNSYNAPVNYHSSYDAYYDVIDSTGSILYSNYYGGSGYEEMKDAMVLDSIHVIHAGRVGSMDGWVTGGNDYYGYKGFLLKTNLSYSNSISGKMFIDYNNNSVQDYADPYVEQAMVQCIKQADTLQTGLFMRNYTPQYEFRVDTGTFIISPVFYNNYFNLVNAPATTSFHHLYEKRVQDFRLVPIAGFKDLQVTLFPVTNARPGFAASYEIVVKNIGTDTLRNVVINLVKDTLRFQRTFTAIPDTLNSRRDTLRWNLTEIVPGSSMLYSCIFNVTPPPATNIGDTVIMKAFANYYNGFLTLENDTSFLKQAIINSFDPNAKDETHAGRITRNDLEKNTPLIYTIFFQNKGTAEAMNVFIKDTLDQKLDWRTLETIASSAVCKLQQVKEKCIWTFENLRLKDSATNEPASHGFVTYRVKPLTDLLTIGDTIKNRAGIYFDYNLPIFTNEQTTAVVGSTMVCPMGNSTFTSDREGTAYQWQVDTGNGYVNISNSINYAGAASKKLLLSNLPAYWYGYKYRCTVTVSNGVVYSNAFLLKFGSIWQGSINSNWEEPGNWSCNTVPDAFTDVFIGGGTAHYPEINVSTVCNSVKGLKGSQLLVKAGATLLLKKFTRPVYSQ